MKNIGKSDSGTQSNTNERINPQLENAKYATSGFELNQKNQHWFVYAQYVNIPRPNSSRPRLAENNENWWSWRTSNAAALWTSLPPHIILLLSRRITVRAAGLRVIVNWLLYTCIRTSIVVLWCSYYQLFFYNLGFLKNLHTHILLYELASVINVAIKSACSLYTSGAPLLSNLKRYKQEIFYHIQLVPKKYTNIYTAWWTRPRHQRRYIKCARYIN